MFKEGLSALLNKIVIIKWPYKKRFPNNRLKKEDTYSMTTKPYKSNCSLSPNLYPVRLLLKCSFSMPTLSWCWHALICTKVSTERARRGTLTQHCTPVHISCRIHVARLSSITGLLTEPSFRQASQNKKKEKDIYLTLTNIEMIHNKKFQRIVFYWLAVFPLPNTHNP